MKQIALPQIRPESEPMPEGLIVITYGGVKHWMRAIDLPPGTHIVTATVEIKMAVATEGFPAHIPPEDIIDGALYDTLSEIRDRVNGYEIMGVSYDFVSGPIPEDGIPF